MRPSLVASLLVLGWAAPLSAEPAPRWALGVEAGDPVAQVAATRRLSSRFAIQLLIGAGWERRVATSPVEVTASSTALRAGLRGRAWVLGDRALRLGAVVELAGHTVLDEIDASTGMEEADAYGLSIELGVRPEWFVTPRLSVHSQLGLEYAWNHRADAGWMHVRVAGDVVGRLGLTWWF